MKINRLKPTIQILTKTSLYGRAKANFINVNYLGGQCEFSLTNGITLGENVSLCVSGLKRRYLVRKKNWWLLGRWTGTYDVADNLTGRNANFKFTDDHLIGSNVLFQTFLFVRYQVEHDRMTPMHQNAKHYRNRNDQSHFVAGSASFQFIDDCWYWSMWIIKKEIYNQYYLADCWRGELAFAV